MKFTFQPETRPLEGYTIKRAIDRGGFGEVYYALSDAGKEVALKLLQHNMDIELRGVRQCLNLKHPNLVTLFDIREDAEGDYWIVMEYVGGQNLERVLAENPRGLPMEQVQRWLHGAARGIAFLHDCGLVHRDVKPGNLFMDQGVVKVGDVGLSKFITPSRRSAHTESVGTVYYMAPEVARGRYGREVDVYSLGAILYEMLTGQVPFDGESTAEILMKHLSAPPDLRPIPERLRPVLARALAKDPALRTPGVTQLVEDFDRAVRGDAPRDVAEFIPPHSFVETRRATHRDTVAAETAAATNGRADDPQRPATLAAEVVALPGRIRSSGWFQSQSPSAKVAITLLAIWLGVMILAGGIGVALLILPLFLPLFLMFAAGCYIIRFLSGTVRELLGPPHPIRAPEVRPARGADEAWSEAVSANVRRPVSPLPKMPPPPRMPRRQVALTPATIRQLPMRQRLAEMTEAMAWAAPLTLLFTYLTHLLTPLFATGGGEIDYSRAGLFGLTALVASWGVLLLAKLTEGRRIDSGYRRLMFLALGALVGTAAYGLDQTLFVELNTGGRPHSLFTHVGSVSLTDWDWQPTALGYIVFFAGLFGLRRWWWHADTFRARRFGIGTLLLTVLLALTLPALWAFPQEGWGVTWAAAISCIVQLSAPWMAPAERARLFEVQSHV